MTNNRDYTTATEGLPARAPVNKLAAKQTWKGTHYRPEKRPQSGTIESRNPLATISVRDMRVVGKQFQDLTGNVKGRLTVIGRSADRPKRWVCRCTCGTYVLRDNTRLKHKHNVDDCCSECKNLRHLKQQDRAKTWTPEPADKTVTIYGFFNSDREVGRAFSVAITHTGVVIVRHVSEAQVKCKQDLVARHARKFTKACPDGWRFEFVSMADRPNHEGLQRAMKLCATPLKLLR